ncbi:four helix bundle protein [Vibrio coralliilyticus]|uniref:four helix bundle protein n=1 Tax=Vibrio coralliilyticus TaxID=190893 RepID=UPI001E56C82E|nr:four helix bundle protein [Vibrio coralliilyticus]MCC2525797.1 four helix bundle protein [Vibrio coralliilyticus]
MNKPFKQNRIYYDLQKLYKGYWNQHQHLPKTFRFTTGEQILNELTNAIRCAVVANLQDKESPRGKQQAIDSLVELNAILETVQCLLLLAWEMKFISHNAMTNFTDAINNLQRQIVGWRRWFQQSRNKRADIPTGM